MKTKNILLSLVAMFALIFVGCDKDKFSDEAQQPAGWYAKTKIYATLDGKVYKHTTAGIFGELVQSSDVKDKHDILSYGTAILQVVFPQTQWQNNNGDYFTNYKSFESTKEEQSWMFQIKNQKTIDLSTSDIKIILDGIYDVTYIEKYGHVQYEEAQYANGSKVAQLTLIDIDNQTTYTPSQLKTANLKMDGKHVRTFRWVIGSVDASDFAVLTQPSGKYAKAVDTQVFKPAVKVDGFGRPPQ